MGGKSKPNTLESILADVAVALGSEVEWEDFKIPGCVAKAAVADGMRVLCKMKLNANGRRVFNAFRLRPTEIEWVTGRWYGSKTEPKSGFDIGILANAVRGELLALESERAEARRRRSGEKVAARLTLELGLYALPVRYAGGHSGPVVSIRGALDGNLILSFGKPVTEAQARAMVKAARECGIVTDDENGEDEDRHVELGVPEVN